MRYRTESGAQVPRDAFRNAGGGADSEPADGIADAAEGSVGNGATGRVLAAADSRAGNLAAADSDGASIGSGDFHRGIWRRHWRALQLLMWRTWRGDGLARIGQRQYFACSTAGVVCDYWHSVANAGAWIESGEHQVRHGFEPGSARLAERPAHPAIAVVCGAQQLQLGSADGLGGHAEAGARRFARAGSADVCVAER